MENFQANLPNKFIKTNKNAQESLCTPKSGIETRKETEKEKTSRTFDACLCVCVFECVYVA